MAHLTISLFGAFRVTAEGNPVTAFTANKVRALLAYLAVESDRPHRREYLASLLWPDLPDQSALANLRITLFDLRRVIGQTNSACPVLLVDRDTIQFNLACGCEVDVNSFVRLRARGGKETSGMVDEDTSVELEAAISLYKGPFLEGFSVGDSEPFEEWARSKREQLQAEVLDALQQLAVSCESQGDYAKAEAYLKRQLALAPWLEEGHRSLMRILAFTGRRSAALTQYHTCEHVLEAELGVEPSEETVAVYQAIKGGKPALGSGFEGPRQGTAKGAAVSGRSVPTRGRAVSGDQLSLVAPTFVGRERELAILTRHLNAALDGHGRVVFIVGEAGSGKTALSTAFARMAIADHPELVVAAGSCDAYAGRGDPYLPFREIIQWLTGSLEGKRLAGSLGPDLSHRLATILPEIARWMVEEGPDLVGLFVPESNLPDRVRKTLVPRSPDSPAWLTRLDRLCLRRSAPAGVKQADLFSQIGRVLQLLAHHHPLILVLDDLQWADGGSLSLLFHLGRRLTGTRILILCAYRPEELTVGARRDLLEPVIHEFHRDFGDVQVDLGQSDGRPFVDALIDARPNRLGKQFREKLYYHTGGHALFTVELLRDLQERGELVQGQDGFWTEGGRVDWIQLPSRVEAVIAERIRRLPPEWQEMLSVASVEGEQFTAEVVARVLGAEEQEVIRRLSGPISHDHHLVVAERLQWVGEQRLSSYRFRHYLFQAYLCQRLDLVEQARLHGAVGNALEALCGTRTRDMAAALALHFEAAGMLDKAVDYLIQAGSRASDLGAELEAISHLNHALALLAKLPECPERDRREVDIRLAMTVGEHRTSIENQEGLDRALRLAERLGEVPRLCSSLYMLALASDVMGDYQGGVSIGERLLRLAEGTGDAEQVAMAQNGLGRSLFPRGNLTTARRYLEQSLAFHRHHPPPPQSRSDSIVSTLTWATTVWWLLGYPEQGQKFAEEAVARARETGVNRTLITALRFSRVVSSILLRDVEAGRVAVHELTQLLQEGGVPGGGPAAQVFVGWLKLEDGQVEEGIDSILAGVDGQRALGRERFHSMHLSLAVEGCRRAGLIERGLDVVADALRHAQQFDERFFEAELRRLKGELLVAKGETPCAEHCFREAIEIAHHQEARLWELRSCTSLGRLLRAQGRDDEVRPLFLPLYLWFSEGFGERDLVDAADLLEAM